MDHGSLTLTFDEATASRLREAAEAAGVSPEAFLRRLVAEALARADGGVREEGAAGFAAADRDPFSEDWAEDLARLAEYDRTGEFVPLKEAMADFRRQVAEKLAKRG